jgi:valyl-tRNA synthetase
MKAIQLISICLLLCLAPPAAAGTIYSWVDADGRQRFSDQPPPNTVKDYKTIQTAPSTSGTSNSPAQRRSSYDQMVENARQESQQTEQKRREEAEARALQEKREAEAQHKARTEPERQRINNEIKELEKRALSPTFSPGMKQAQIEKLRKQLKQLDEPLGNGPQ